MIEPARTLRVLLVEDNPGDARLLREAFRETDSAVDLVHTERLGDAIEMYRDTHVDAVLLDLALPDSSGMDTVGWALRAFPAVPILVLTGTDDDAVAIRAVELGAQDYMYKGDVTPRSLRRAVRYALERARLSSENARLLAREREAREEAERAVQLREEVHGIVAHDLRNPLSSIRMAASAVLETSIEPRQQTGFMEAIVRSTEFIDRLISDLLDVATIEGGALRLDLIPIGPAALLKLAHDALTDEARRLGVDLRCDADLDAGPVLADPDRIQQLLVNLGTNALRFAPAGTAVTLTAYVVGDGVAFSVEDRGPGIPADELSRLFDRFWRSRSHSHPGAGLGLSIARGIAEGHGGALEVESEPGVRTVFRFTLPLASPASAELGPAPV